MKEVGENIIDSASSRTANPLLSLLTIGAVQIRVPLASLTSGYSSIKLVNL